MTGGFRSLPFRGAEGPAFPRSSGMIGVIRAQCIGFTEPAGIKCIVFRDPVDLTGNEVDGNILDLPGRDAAIDSTCFHPGAFQDHRTGGNDRITTDLGIVHDDGPHPDQHFVTYGATMYDRIMSDGYIAADYCLGSFVCAMDNHAILYIHFISDPDDIDITPYYSIEPNAAIVPHHYITYDRSIGCDKAIFSKLREDSLYR